MPEPFQFWITSIMPTLASFCMGSGLPKWASVMPELAWLWHAGIGSVLCWCWSGSGSVLAYDTGPESNWCANRYRTSVDILNRSSIGIKVCQYWSSTASILQCLLGCGSSSRRWIVIWNSQTLFVSLQIGWKKGIGLEMSTEHFRSWLIFLVADRAVFWPSWLWKGQRTYTVFSLISAPGR